MQWPAVTTASEPQRASQHYKQCSWPGSFSMQPQCRPQLAGWQGQQQQFDGPMQQLQQHVAHQQPWVASEQQQRQQQHLHVLQPITAVIPACWSQPQATSSRNTVSAAAAAAQHADIEALFRKAEAAIDEFMGSPHAVVLFCSDVSDALARLCSSNSTGHAESRFCGASVRNAEDQGSPGPKTPTTPVTCRKRSKQLSAPEAGSTDAICSPVSTTNEGLVHHDVLQATRMGSSSDAGASSSSGICSWGLDLSDEGSPSPIYRRRTYAQATDKAHSASATYSPNVGGSSRPSNRSSTGGARRVLRFKLKGFKATGKGNKASETRSSCPGGWLPAPSKLSKVSSSSPGPVGQHQHVLDLSTTSVLLESSRTQAGGSCCDMVTVSSSDRETPAAPAAATSTKTRRRQQQNGCCNSTDATSEQRTAADCTVSFNTWCCTPAGLDRSQKGPSFTCWRAPRATSNWAAANTAATPHLQHEAAAAQPPAQFPRAPGIAPAAALTPKVATLLAPAAAVASATVPTASAPVRSGACSEQQQLRVIWPHCHPGQHGHVGVSITTQSGTGRSQRVNSRVLILSPADHVSCSLPDRRSPAAGAAAPCRSHSGTTAGHAALGSTSSGCRPSTGFVQQHTWHEQQVQQRQLPHPVLPPIKTTHVSQQQPAEPPCTAAGTLNWLCNGDACVL